MKKNLAIIIIALVAVMGCNKGGKYADIKSFMNNVIDANEEYITALEKASTAKEVASAINDLSDKMEKLSKRGIDLEKKYPELKNIDKNNPPEELRDVYKRLGEMGQRMAKASMKMMKYAMDPEVLKATKQMAEKSQKFGFFK